MEKCFKLCLTTPHLIGAQGRICCRCGLAQKAFCRRSDLLSCSPVSDEDLNGEVDPFSAALHEASKRTQACLFQPGLFLHFTRRRGSWISLPWRSRQSFDANKLKIVKSLEARQPFIPFGQTNGYSLRAQLPSTTGYGTSAKYHSPMKCSRRPRGTSKLLFEV